uniref:Uncharacterized protein n=1 Tax=Arundo donax TaxID=35708 RepID=A0A0A9BBQ0_ARUDO
MRHLRHQRPVQQVLV